MVAPVRHPKGGGYIRVCDEGYRYFGRSERDRYEGLLGLLERSVKLSRGRTARRQEMAYHKAWSYYTHVPKQREAEEYCTWWDSYTEDY